MKALTNCLFVGFIFMLGTSASQATYSYLALGDSYTIGEGVSENESWPFQLTARLRKEGAVMSDPQIIARTGWRTDNLMTAIEEEALSAKFDLVSLLIGVNNQFQGKSIEVYERDLKILLETATSYAKSGKEGVFVLSIPDYGSTPFGKLERVAIGAEIDRWNEVCKNTCEASGILFLDITAISKKAAEDSELTVKDRLHPSRKMYALWVEAIWKEVAGLLAANKHN